MTLTNNYYLLLYLFCFIFLLGILLGIYQADFFTGFLWVTEFTLIFILLILLFYLNVVDLMYYVNAPVIYSFFIISVIFLFPYIYLEINYSLPFSSNIILYWEDYYESLYNVNLNDFTCLFLSYYTYNSLVIILLGLFLFIASIICVHLNLLFKFNKLKNLVFQKNLFANFFNIFSFNLLRKQHLNEQSLIIPAVKIFKKK